MCKKGKTIYQTARLSTDMTQEKVAEMLHISMKSIGAYERGETIPPDYVVVSMANLYDAEWLGLVHLKTNNDVGKKFGLSTLIWTNFIRSTAEIQLVLSN